MLKITLTTIILLIFTITSFSQINKIGYHKNTIFDFENKTPCKTSDNNVWFCQSNGAMVCYTFEADQVVKVFYMWEFKALDEAQQDVEINISNYNRQFGRATMKDGRAFWFVDNYIYSASYGFTGGKHYSCLSISLLK